MSGHRSFGPVLTLGLATVAVLAPAASAGGPGSSVKGFGSRGVLKVPAASHLSAVVTQRDGKLVVAGDKAVGRSTRLFVARLTSTGHTDRSFNRGRPVLGAVGTSAQAVAVDSKGRIVVGGTATRGGSSALLVGRVSSRGRVDGSFGSRGFATALNSGIGRAIVVNRDGSVVVGGSGVASDGYPRAVVARFSSRGRLDPRFGQHGTALLDLGKFSVVNALGASRGKIVLAGSRRNDLQTTQTVLAQVTSSGQLDRGFGQGGSVIQQLAGAGAAYSSFDALAVQPDGKILAGGSASQTPRSPQLTASEAIVERFTRGGGIDRSWAGGVARRPAAKAQLLPSGTFPGVTGLAIGRGGNVFAAGSFYESRQDVVAFGFTRGGRALRRFGKGGTVRTQLGSAVSAQPRGLALGKRGELVVVGQQGGVFGGRTSGFVLSYTGL